MDHMDEDRLLASVLDGEALTTAEQAHLAICVTCQGALKELARLHDDVRVFVRSEVSEATLARYQQLAQAIPVSRKDPLQELARWITGHLVFDSRNQALAAGVRSAGGRGYRMLYSGESAEVELLVEAEHGARRVEGELLTDADTEALVQLAPHVATWPVLETETTVRGRFSLTGVRPGRYDLILTGAMGTTLTLRDVEIT